MFKVISVSLQQITMSKKNLHKTWKSDGEREKNNDKSEAYGKTHTHEKERIENEERKTISLCSMLTKSKIVVCKKKESQAFFFLVTVSGKLQVGEV